MFERVDRMTRLEQGGVMAAKKKAKKKAAKKKAKKKTAKKK
jgi:hypothetical protein